MKDHLGIFFNEKKFFKAFFQKNRFFQNEAQNFLDKGFNCGLVITMLTVLNYTIVEWALSGILLENEKTKNLSKKLIVNEDSEGIECKWRAFDDY
jgi:hypothetical protein